MVKDPVEYPWSSFHYNTLGREDRLINPYVVYNGHSSPYFYADRYFIEANSGTIRARSFEKLFVIVEIRYESHNCE